MSIADRTPVADVAVIGAGPAGTTVAARLAQLGYRVEMVDRGRARRTHICEILAAPTLDLLAMTGAERSVLQAGFPAAEAMTVAWEAPRVVRAMPRGSLLVDRHRFDALLLDRALELGVTVTGGNAVRRRRLGSSWEIALDGDRAPVCARFVVDASGRRSNLRHSRPDALLGVTGRWNVALDRPTVVTVDEGWVWAAPGPAPCDGVPWCEVTVFVDPTAWRVLGADPVTRYVRLVEAAGIVSPAARLTGGLTARDATSALATEVCGCDWLAVGDTALALDPLSSSGVQRAVQSALTAAVVIHTAMTRPADAALALDHYRHGLARAAEHHADWTGESYAAVAAVRSTAFWTTRATTRRTDGSSDASLGRRASRFVPSPEAVVRRSPLVRFVEVSQVVGDSVRLAPALEHPGVDGAVAYVAGTPVVPLLAPMNGVATMGELVGAWAGTMPAATAVELAHWLFRRGVIEEAGV
ncbi:MAG TPA: FAD-dependent monooxygenase [Ilumatobacter sp.]|nr:FAD-dependent monooxygenase [Ilumatobacter sp.]